jgi:hypothetical protein
MMKNLSKTPEYCNYSFDDLYKAAFGKKMPQIEKLKLQRLSQEGINELVIAWVQQAGWQTFARTGTDGKKYVAFYP